MRNMRQFMSGMKNYLVKHGEKGFDKEVEKERNKVFFFKQIKLHLILVHHQFVYLFYVTFVSVEVNRISKFGCHIRRCTT